MPRLCGLLIWISAITPGVSWADDCIHHEQSLEGLPISSISIDNANIFDPEDEEENLWIHRVANSLHIKTQKKTIEGLILFDRMQPYSEQLVEETERMIRSKGYIHDARIESDPVCGEGVRLKVLTTDNWTLTPNISIDSSGGETRTSFELEESNLLGLGTSINLKSESDEDRDEDSVSFYDSNWLGNHKNLNLTLSNNSDGYFYATRLYRPFVQLDSRYAWSVEVSALELERPVYTDGVLSDKVGETAETAQVSYGWSKGLVGDSVTRFQVGWAFSDKEFFQTDDFPLSEIPESEISSYPFFGYSLLQPIYLTMTNFRVMEVSEDISIGDSFSFDLGWKDEAFGSDERGLVVGVDYNYGSRIANRTLWFVDLSLDYEANAERDDKGFFSLGGRFYHYRAQDHSYLINGAIETALNPENFEEYVLGGDSGLKGYPIRYQSGDTKATFALEDRFYFDWYPWKLLKFGTAVFFETGSAWVEEDGPNFISDVGFGLRVVSTRQSKAKVLHADIAFPLSERGQVDSYQLFLKARAEF